MDSASSQGVENPLRGSKALVIGTPKLNHDVRLIIWRALYAAQSPRIVEIRCQHDCSKKHKDWCPRYSRSPPPVVVNVCQESRHEAQRVARRAGHLVFFSKQPQLPPIYFNPDIDTLLLCRDPAPCNYNTALNDIWQRQNLRRLAMKIPPNRNAAVKEFRDALACLKNLEEFTFVVAKVTPNAVGRVMTVNKRCSWALDPVAPTRLVFGAVKVKKCELAVRRGTSLESVDWRMDQGWYREHYGRKRKTAAAQRTRHSKRLKTAAEAAA
jgi:2EXR family